MVNLAFVHEVILQGVPRLPKKGHIRVGGRQFWATGSCGPIADGKTCQRGDGDQKSPKIAAFPLFVFSIKNFHIEITFRNRAKSAKIKESNDFNDFHRQCGFIA
jgi:hypothetical protein